eukprot:gene14556-16119_t
MTAFELMTNHDAEMEDLINFYLAQADNEETEEALSSTSEDCSTLPSPHEQTLPDSVIQMCNAKICKRLDEKGSRIMGSFHAQGTAIYLPRMYNGVPVDRNDSISQYSVNPMDLVYVEDFMTHLQLAATPMMMQLSGTFEMILDEEHRFVSASILCNDIKISQLIS